VLEYVIALSTVLVVIGIGVVFLWQVYDELGVEVQELRHRVGVAPDLVGKFDEYHTLVEKVEDDLRGLVATQGKELRVELSKKADGEQTGRLLEEVRRKGRGEVDSTNEKVETLRSTVEELRSQLQSIASWSKSLAPKAESVGVGLEELAGNVQTLGDQVKESVREIYGRVAAVEITVEQLTALANDVRELRGDVNANRSKLREEIEDVASDLRYFREVFGKVEGRIAAKFSSIAEGLTKISEAVTKS
jgi:chromosome segregation ATPase